MSELVTAPAPAPDPLIGKTLAHFRVDAPLGRGGMGAVYRAWDSSLQRAVALKVLLHDSPQTRQRFMREARAQARIKNPNVVPIHFVGEDAGIAFLVMDLVEGESLSSILRRGALPVDRALEVTDAIARALEAGAEQGLVHRDVKPSNVLIDRHGHVMLADFGLAKWLDAPPQDDTGEPPAPAAADPGHSGVVTRAGVAVGTPAYAAPEQARGEEVDGRADIYALGVTLYESITGQAPFSAPTVTGLVAQHLEEVPLAPRVLVPSLSTATDALVLRMMAKKAEDRFATPAALRAAIAAARARPRTDAAPFVRALALAIDAAVFGIGGALATMVWEPLAVPAMVLLMGSFEGWLGMTPGKGLLQLRTIDGRGDPPGVRLGLLRTVVKMWGPLVMGLAAELLPDGRALEAVNIVCVLAWLGSSSVVLFGARRSLHDRLGGTRVVYGI